MLRHQLVLSYVNQQLGFQKLLQNVFGGHVDQRLLRRGRHSLLHDDDRSVNVLLLHSLTVSLDGFNSDLGFVREEDEHLIGGVVIVSHEDRQGVSRGVFFAEAKRMQSIFTLC